MNPNNITQILFRYAKENNCVTYLRKRTDVINYINPKTMQYNGSIKKFNDILYTIYYQTDHTDYKICKLLFLIIKPFIDLFIKNNNLIDKINANLEQNMINSDIKSLQEYYQYIESSQRFSIDTFFIIKDVGSGLNDNRSGFVKLTDLVIQGKVNKLVIEHKDRLTRFQFKFIKKMFESYGCEVIVINGIDVSDTEELATDMMSLLASFSGKFYGKRSAERRKKNKEKQNEK